MPRRISRLGGTTLRRSFMTNAYSPGMVNKGPRYGPYPPFFLSGGAEQAAVLGHHAAVLHDTNACARQRLRRAVVADAQLEPDDRGLPRQPDDLGRVARQELRATEDLDDVRGLTQVGERGGDRLAEDALAGPRRVHGQHAVPARPA